MGNHSQHDKEDREITVKSNFHSSVDESSKVLFDFNNVLWNIDFVGGCKWYRRHAIDALDLHPPYVSTEFGN